MNSESKYQNEAHFFGKNMCFNMCHIFSSKSVNSRSYISAFFFLLFPTLHIYICIQKCMCTKQENSTGKSLMCVVHFFFFFGCSYVFFALAYQWSGEKIYAALERRGLCPLKVSSNGKCYSCSLPAISFKQEPEPTRKKLYIYALRVYTKWMAHFRQGST